MALSSMTPGARRVAILICELMTFLVGSAFAAYFISHAGALQIAAGEATPAQFPVLAYEGDRARPQAGNYKVMPWQEWEAFAAGKPGASLLPPESAGADIRIGDAGVASFRATEEGPSRKTVELTWRTAGGEQVARYVAQERAIEARYLRTLGSQTLLMSIVVGFVAGIFTGRALRRRWLVQPASFTPPPAR
jgi:hypothetical protein